MAWVEQSGQRSWRVRYRRHGTVDSVSGFRSRRTAEAYAADLETDRRRRVGIDPADSATTVTEWVSRWFRSLDLDPRTIESYRCRLRCHILPRFGATALGAITTLDITEWTRELNQAGYAPATVSSQINLLSMILTDAADERLIPFNPVRRRRRRGRRSRRITPERIWAMPDQVLRIADQAALLGGPIARLLIITAAWTGCRWGELAGLHRNNLNLEHGTLTIDPEFGTLHESATARWLGPPKTRASARTITLPPFLVELLREHLAQHRNEFVFTTPSGTWLWRSTFIRRVLRPAADGNTDIAHPAVRCHPIRPGLTFHGLRHSHKTWLIAGGTPEIAQARRLGHHLDNRVIETYSHVAPEVEQRLLTDLEQRWQALQPIPPAPPSPPEPDMALAVVVPLFATAGVNHHTPPRPAATEIRHRRLPGSVPQNRPTRVPLKHPETITRDQPAHAKNPSDQPKRLNRRGPWRLWS